MKHRLEDLVDIPRLQELTDRLYDAAGIPSAIITMEGKILTGSGWQRICTDFHRKHPDIEKECIESDIAIREKLDAGAPFSMYTCPRGLTDASVPIVIEGEHLANAFAGQLFLEAPGERTEQHFRQQARRFGFDEEAYVDAFREVPVVPVERFRASLLFLANLADMIARHGLQRKLELDANEQLRRGEDKYRTLFENMTEGVFYQRADGTLVDCNSALLEMFGLTRDEFFGRTSMHPEWRVFSEDGSPIPGDQHPSMRALRTGEPVRDAVLKVFNPRRQDYLWLVVNAIPQFEPGAKKPSQVFVTLHDYTERKTTELELRQFEWLLEKEEQGVEGPARVYSPTYQDPAELNTARVIRDGVGRDTLASMARDMLDLLDTCVAVYEANGDYAYGVFESGWCQMMDAASFELCGTEETGEALACGKWLCHENCWNESAKAAIQSGRPTDIECVGGIRLYAVPIRAGNDIIGAMNIGYSSPPRSEAKFRELSDRFHLDIEQLRSRSSAYKPRPPFIIDVAKRRCRSIAEVIGHAIERQRTEASLATTEALHRTLVETIPDLVWLKDEEGVFLSCNRSFERLFGAHEAEIIGKMDRDFVSAELADFFRGHDRRAMAANGPVINEEWLTFAEDGYRGLFETIKAPLVTEDGRTIGVLGIARDITERRRTQDEIEATARERSWLLNSMINAFVIFESVFDDSGRFTSYRFEYINKAYEDITGVRLEEVRGKTVHQVWPGTEDSWIAAYGKVATTGEPLTFSMFHGPTDKTYHCHVYRPWETQDRFCVVFDDITEQRRNEEEKKRLEQQLHQSRRMEAIGSLAGGVAHDFNNLLSVILSYTKFALDTLRDGDPLKDDLAEVKKAGERAVALTCQLLAFSRKQMLQPVTLDLNKIAMGVEKMLRRILGEDIDIVQKLAPDLGLTTADPSQIEQVLMNLAVNARDAMPDGGKLTVETSNVEVDEEYAARHVAVKPGSYVQIAVTDTGCGMDEKTKARIFEPFFTTKEKGKGTGLGLSTVYGIVQQSGGNIWVYSELGKGTTFKIYLPRDSSATTATAIKSATIPTTFEGTETILVVEDEEALRKVAKRCLEAVGYRVLTASDGEEALLVSARYGGDIPLLLTDVVMPRMSGRVLAQELSRTRPSIKVIYMSGYTDDAIGHHGVLDPGTHFLAKPFTSTALTQKVREVLDEGLPLSTR